MSNGKFYKLATGLSRVLASVLAVSQIPDMDAQEAKKGHRESIKVHGHWTIEVRNPDGRLVTHREFENALYQPTGQPGLANVLGRVHSVGFWEVSVSNDPSQITQPCPFGCTVGESGDTSPANAFPNLTVSVPINGVNAGKLVLNGSFTPQFTSPLASGSTSFFYCPGATAPVNCGSPQNQLTFFTVTFFTPINATAGQLVQVTVVISFS